MYYYVTISNIYSILLLVSSIAYHFLPSYHIYGFSGVQRVTQEHLQKFKAALINIHTEMRVPQPDYQVAFFKEYFKGLKNVQATDRKSGRMNERAGKDPLSNIGYRALAKMALKNGHCSTQLFAHPYLILDWNLMSRAESCGNLMFQHITWNEDSLKIQ
jgi:hypothetical protein